MLCSLPFRDTDRVPLVTAMCVHRVNRGCAQENIFDTVVAGAAAEGVSPEIDVRTQKDGVALFKDNSMQRATRVNKDITGIWCAGHIKPAFRATIMFKINVNYLVLITSLLQTNCCSQPVSFF